MTHAAAGTGHQQLTCGHVDGVRGRVVCHGVVEDQAHVCREGGAVAVVRALNVDDVKERQEYEVEDVKQERGKRCEVKDSRGARSWR